jgi:hypothetical protein
VYDPTNTRRPLVYDPEIRYQSYHGSGLKTVFYSQHEHSSALYVRDRSHRKNAHTYAESKQERRREKQNLTK